MKYLKCYGECEGPFGFPMKEAAARELDAFLKEHSEDSAFTYKHFSKGDSLECFIPGEHADVSIVTDGSIDKDGEIVNPHGLDWETFRKNPSVTLGHNYWAPPVGKSIWQKIVGGGKWKAKTIYASRPDSLPAEKEWLPDTIWHLIKTHYMPGKSIGFLPTKWHEPTKEERDGYASKGISDVSIIFDEAKIFEYAVVTIGSNDNAVVDEVSKGELIIPEEYAGAFPDKWVKSFTEKQQKEKEIKEQKLSIKGVSLKAYEESLSKNILQRINNININEVAEDTVARMLGKV